MDRELFKKVLKEEPLSVEEALALDGALEGARSQAVSRLVSGLDDDALSLRWRSELNQKLMSASRQRRAASYWRFGLTASAVTAACVFALSLFNPLPERESPPVRIAEQSVEDAILSEHQGAVGEASLGVHVPFEETGS